MKKGIISSIAEGGFEALIISVLQGFGKVAKEEGVTYLKSNFLNLGNNDEVLYHSASDLALKMKLISPEELAELETWLLANYEPLQIQRLKGIIGKGEKAVTLTSPKIVNGEVQKNKKGEDIIEKSTFSGNIDGANMLTTLCHQTPEQRKVHLKMSGAVNSPVISAVAKLKKAADDMGEKAKNSQVAEDIEQLSEPGQELWIERMLREAKQRRGII